MTRTPRLPKPLAVTIGLLLVASGGGLLTAAALSGGETFTGLQRGDPLYMERGLSANTVTLAVYVNAISERERPQAVDDAVVSIYQWTRDGAEPLTRSLTGDNGIARFELRPDRYYIAVEHDGNAARHAMSLDKDTRLSVLIDEEGNIHFQSASRQEIRERGAMHTLFVRVAQAMEDERGRQAVEGATIHVHAYTNDDERGDPIARNTTDARGGAGFYLPEGRYLVTVQAPDGQQTSFRVGLNEDTSKVVTFPADDTDTQRPQDAPDAQEPEKRPRPQAISEPQESSISPSATE